jgi:hypothetical protein
VNQMATKAAPIANAMRRPRPAPAKTCRKVDERKRRHGSGWESDLEAQLAEKPALAGSIVFTIVCDLLFVDGRGKGAVTTLDDLLDETEENGDDEGGFECLSEY